MKLLNGSELAGFIKERQRKSVVSFSHLPNATPTLAIVYATQNPAVQTYMRLKSNYAADIGVEVKLFKVADLNEAKDTIADLNNNPSVSGIILQLPTDDFSAEGVINEIAPHKDVDGLVKNSHFDSATATAVLWLLNGYNIELVGKKIGIVGKGRLVGAPLTKLLQSMNIEPLVITKKTTNAAAKVYDCDVVVTATGSPHLITPDWLKPGAVVVDAGVAGEGGQLMGDVHPDVYEKSDLKAITPVKGGLGPLTVCCLFENVIQAHRRLNTN